MFQLKVFRSDADSDGKSLESAVNDWLAEHPNMQIEKMTQSESRSHHTSYFMLTFLCREG